jgi:replicative DNA helicase
MGKTAWAINIAQQAALRDGRVVGIFSLEMSSDSLLRRMLASEAFVNMRKIQSGFISRDDQDALINAAAKLTESHIYIDDTPGISLAEMRAKARRLKQQRGLDLIVVDYLQLMSASLPGIAGGKRHENRTQEVSAISRGLKALAKELHIPVIALSQLSRASEQRGGDKKPMLSDLRESGSIEQDADVVMFVYREEYYLKSREPEAGTTEYAAWLEKLERVHNRAEILVEKHRHGPTNKVDLFFDERFTRFSNLATPD